MRFRILAVFAALIPAIVMGQSFGSVSGPSLGFVFDNSERTLRPLLGVAGSATIGEPIALGYALTDALTLHDGYILAAPQEGTCLVTVNLGVNPPDTRVIAGASITAQIALSPGGKAAALTYPDENLIKVITGLPDKPEVSREIKSLTAPPHRVAVNDNSSALLVSFIENGSENIYRWNATEGFRFLKSVSQVSAMMFIGTSEAIFADSNTNEVFKARDVQTMSVTQFIAGPEDGVSSPIGIGFSGKSGYFLANAGSNSVMNFDSSGQIRQKLDCGCSLSGLRALGSGAYRLTDKLNQTLYILDDNGAQSRILFVPPIHPSVPSP